MEWKNVKYKSDHFLGFQFLKDILMRLFYVQWSVSDQFLYTIDFIEKLI